MFQHKTSSSGTVKEPYDALRFADYPNLYTYVANIRLPDLICTFFECNRTRERGNYTLYVSVKVWS